MKMLIEQRAVMNVDGKQYEVFRNTEDKESCLECDLFKKCQDANFSWECYKRNGQNVSLKEVN